MALTLFAMGFAELAGHVMEGNLASVDRTMREGTMNGRPGALVAVFDAISWIGRTDRLAVVGGIVGLLLFPRRWSWPILLALCVIATNNTVDWLKDSFEVARPIGGTTASSHSFPSGHASGSMAVVVFLSYVAIRHYRHPWLFVSGAAIVGMLVGISRIYLDKHWTSDVMGGWIVGASFGAAFAAIYEWVLRHQLLRTPRESVPTGPGATRS